ncbi:MAG: peptidase U32 family protein [Patescibacteria group bacterium]
MKDTNVELLAPAGSYESLMTAINAGCDAVYFGVDGFNMRQNNSAKFSLDDLKKIAEICHENKIRCYLALNTLVYDKDIEKMKAAIDAVKEAGVDAIITFDMSALVYAREIGVEVHISTQHSISNIEAVKFFAQWADRMVLARELSIEDVKKIVDEIKEQDIRGPKGSLIEIEIFIHGAMCVSVSGRCGMSLYMNKTSANCGECTQPCRRPYQIIDQQTNKALVIDNEFVMSPEDLCTIGLLDEIIATGVVSLKVEGRGRTPEYVDMVIRTYREAIKAIKNDTYTPEKIKQWNMDLGTVFNKGLSDGFYRGKPWGYWSGVSGNKAKQTKELVGTVKKYYPNISVAEIEVHASDIKEDDQCIFIGKTTGLLRTKPQGMMIDEQPVDYAKQGDMITFKVPDRVRGGDKLYKIIPNK